MYSVLSEIAINSNLADSTSKKPIGILNLKLWTEFHLTPLNRYLRPQQSSISEETLIRAIYSRKNKTRLTYK